MNLSSIKNGYFWLSDLDEIVISINDDRYVRFGGVNGIEEFFLNNNSNEIHIRNAKDFFKPLFINSCEPLATEIAYRTQRQDYNSSNTCNFTLFYNECKIEIPPNIFVDKFFLTRSKRRIITPYTTDTITACLECGQSYRVFKKVYFEDGTSAQSSIYNISNSNTIKLREVKVDFNAIKEGYSKRIVAFDIIIQYPDDSFHQRISYVVHYDYQMPIASFRFRNPFGVFEDIHIYGTDTTTHKFEKSFARINQIETTYKNKLTTTHKISTTIMRQEMRTMMEDLFASSHVYLIEDDKIIGGVVIDEIEHETSSAYDALDSYQFSWRLSDSDHRTQLPYGIFDETFDDTFE